MNPYVVVEERSGSMQTVVLSRPTHRVGRSHDSDIMISDPTVSRQHIEIRREQAGFVLEDLGSSNGTYVDGHLARTQSLRHGSLIRIGTARLRFYWPEEAASDFATQRFSRAKAQNTAPGGVPYAPSSSAAVLPFEGLFDPGELRQNAWLIFLIAVSLIAVAASVAAGLHFTPHPIIRY